MSRSRARGGGRCDRTRDAIGQVTADILLMALALLRGQLGAPQRFGIALELGSCSVKCIDSDGFN